MRRFIHSLLNITPAVHQYVITKLRARFLRSRYAVTAARIRRKSRQGEKIRVLFLVNETAKWKAQSIFDLLSKDARYKVSIAVSIGDTDSSLSHEERSVKVSSRVSWFEKQGIDNCLIAYDPESDTPLPLDKFKPDIVFYHQPWFLPPCQMPRVVSRYALTCYIPYFVPTFANNTMHCQLQLHKDIYWHFVLNDDWKNFYLSEIDISEYAGNILATGHPILDAIKLREGESREVECVIYAPHWSICHPNNPNEINLSTFLDTGKPILDYARSHPEINWIFRPHPTLRLALKRTLAMTEQEIERYYSEWAEIGEVSEGGGYVDIFNRSRALITDCDSFLSEYAFTGKPIVWLISKVKNKRHFSPFKYLFDTYYKVFEASALEDVLNEVVVKQRDYRKPERIAAIKRTGLISQDSARMIAERIESLLVGNKK